MVMFLMTALVIAAGLALVALVVAKDGYGTRPGPRSHVDPFPSPATFM